MGDLDFDFDLEREERPFLSADLRDSDRRSDLREADRDRDLERLRSLGGATRNCNTINFTFYTTKLHYTRYYSQIYFFY